MRGGLTEETPGGGYESDGGGGQQFRSSDFGLKPCASFQPPGLHETYPIIRVLFV